MKYNLPLKDNKWFTGIKWDNHCIECQADNGGVCHDRNCAEDNYDPWGDVIPAYVYHMDGNDLPQYIEEKAKRMGYKCQYKNVEKLRIRM